MLMKVSCTHLLSWSSDTFFYYTWKSF